MDVGGSFPHGIDRIVAVALAAAAAGRNIVLEMVYDLGVGTNPAESLVGPMTGSVGLGMLMHLAQWSGHTSVVADAALENKVGSGMLPTYLPPQGK